MTSSTVRRRVARTRFTASIIGRLYHWMVKIAFGLRISDVDCDFRLFRRSIFDKVELTKDSGVICLELMKKVQDHGFRIEEVPVNHYHRVYGKSQFFNFPRIGKTLDRRRPAMVRSRRAQGASSAKGESPCPNHCVNARAPRASSASGVRARTFGSMEAKPPGERHQSTFEG